MIMYNCNEKVVGCPGIPDNPALAPITDKLPEIKQMDSTINITPGNVRRFLIIIFNTYLYNIYHRIITE